MSGSTLNISIKPSDLFVDVSIIGLWRLANLTLNVTS